MFFEFILKKITKIFATFLLFTVFLSRTPVIKFKPKIENTVSNFTSANHLVTGWALENLGRKKEAVEWLNAQIKQYPDNKILEWCKQVFENEQPSSADTKDTGVRLLEQLIRIK